MLSMLRDLSGVEEDILTIITSNDFESYRLVHWAQCLGVPKLAYLDF